MDAHLEGDGPRASATRQGHSHAPFPLGPFVYGEEHTERWRGEWLREGALAPCLGGPPHLGVLSPPHGWALPPPLLPTPAPVVLSFLRRPGGVAETHRSHLESALWPDDLEADRPSPGGFPRPGPVVVGRGQSRTGMEDEIPGLGLWGRAGHPRAPSEQRPG